MCLLQASHKSKFVFRYLIEQGCQKICNFDILVLFLLTFFKFFGYITTVQSYTVKWWFVFAVYQKLFIKWFRTASFETVRKLPTSATTTDSSFFLILSCLYRHYLYRGLRCLHLCYFIPTHSVVVIMYRFKLLLPSYQSNLYKAVIVPAQLLHHKLFFHN